MSDSQAAGVLSLPVPLPAPFDFVRSSGTGRGKGRGRGIEQHAKLTSSRALGQDFRVAGIRQSRSPQPLFVEWTRDNAVGAASQRLVDGHAQKVISRLPRGG